MIGVFRFLRGLIIKPKSGASTADEAGSLEVLSSNNKLTYHNGTSTSPVVTEAHAATLENKTIDADDNSISNLEVDNLKANVLNTNGGLTGASDTQVPSALAAKTYADTGDAGVQTNLDNHINESVSAHAASAIGVVVGTVEQDNVQSALENHEERIDIIESDIADDVEGPASATDNALARFDGTSGKLIQSSTATLDDAGKLTVQEFVVDTAFNINGTTITADSGGGNFSQIAMGSGRVLITTNEFRTFGSHTAIGSNNGATGSNATVAIGNNKTITLNNASLVSIDMLSGGNGFSGQEVTLINMTGNAITINNLTGATAAQQIKTPSGAALTVPNQSGVVLVFNGTNWSLIGIGTLKASDVTNVPSGNLSATDQQGVNNELQGDIDTLNTNLSDHIADTSTHGVTGDIVGTTDVQNVANKTITESGIYNPTRLDVKKDTFTNLEAYALSASNGQIVFATDTKEMYQIVDSELVAVGSGDGGGTSDPDVLTVQSFESATIADFTEDGLELVNDADNAPVLNGLVSARLTHQAGTSQYFTQTVPVPTKFRGQNMTGYITLRSTATSGNVTVTVNDDINAVTLQTLQLQTDSFSISGTTTSGSATVSGISTSDIGLLAVGMSVTGTNIPAGTTIGAIGTSTILLNNALASGSGSVTLRISPLPKTLQFGFKIPNDCAQISYTVTALQESGSPETYVDDIKIANYWMGASNQGQSEVLVPTIIQQSSDIRNQAATVSAATVTGALTTQNGSGLYSYNASTGIYTVLEDAEFNLSFTGRAATAAAAAPNILVDGTVVALTHTPAVANQYATTSYNGILTAGQTFYFANSAANAINLEYISVSATGVTTTTITTQDLVPAKAVLGNSTFEVPVVTQQSSYLSTATSVSSNNVTGALTSQSGSGIYSYDSGTGIYTMLEDAEVVLNYTNQAAGAASAAAFIKVDGAFVAGDQGHAAAGVYQSVSYSAFLTTGQTFEFEVGSNSANNHKIAVSATAVISDEITVSGTQQLLTEAQDSMIQLSGANGFGSTATTTRRFSTILQSIGSDVLYSDSATNGASFTIQTDGVYSISYTEGSDVSATTSGVLIQVNGTAVAADRDISSAATTSSRYNNAMWTGYLNEGDVVTPVVFIAASNDGDTAYFTISKQGSTKVVNTVSDQRIEIPTSELRFEGASARGSTATAIVKFDSIAKIRGDAFTVTNTAADGTYVTMTKAGKLAVSTSLQTTSSTSYISINQSTLTAVPSVASEILAAQTTNSVGALSWIGNVKVGDVIRVSTNNTVTNATLNNFNLSFQEQEIQVSVSNTLPQFSESDSCIRLNTANGYGSTGTMIRRFSNVTDNIGTDIVYQDSATLGGSFTVQSSGIYNISYTDNFTSAAYLGISRNASSLSTAIGALSASEILTNGVASDTAGRTDSVSWSGYLNAGDVIRAHTSGIAVSAADRCYFTISKVGKPNVTGVDVTPFIEIPNAPTTQSAWYSTSSATITTTPDGSRGTVSDLFSVSSSTITVLKNCKLSVGIATALTGTEVNAFILLNGAIVSRDRGREATSVGQAANATFEYDAVVGDTLTITGTTGTGTLAVSATAFSSDQILTPIESFSTDTAPLTYASSSQYTLSTLANAPVGTFITWTLAASTNTLTQTTTAPTQTTTDMNTNGIQLFTRAYNATSTAGSPARIAIQIGKGMKGVDLQGYLSTSKSDAIYRQDRVVRTGTSERGYNYTYNTTTGVLIIDLGSCQTTSTTTADLVSETSSGTSGYFVINASKNPALAGVSISRVGAEYTSNSGQAIGTSATLLTYEDVVRDTHNAYNAGVYTVPESGWYQIDAALLTASVTIATNGNVELHIYKNGTVYKTGRIAGNGTATFQKVDVSASVYLSAGETIDIRANTSVATTMYATTTNYNWFTISKVSGIN